jgi:integrase
VPGSDNSALSEPTPASSAERIEQYRRLARAPNTSRGYRSDWEHYARWCDAHGERALPGRPEAVAAYLADHADRLKVATLQRRLAAIAKTHRAAGHPSPAALAHRVVDETWKGIRRAKGVAPSAKAPLLAGDLREMMGALAPGLLGARDRALLLLGFGGAFRRSELVALNVEDVEFCAEGLLIMLRRSKTDQERVGRTIGIPFGSDPRTCACRGLRAWLDTAELTGGPLFRPVNRHGRVAEQRLSDRAVALIVKRSAEAIGRNPDEFAGHSLRAGLVTSAALAGASETSIMAQTGHRSAAMVRRYVRLRSVFQNNAAAKLGL